MISDPISLVIFLIFVVVVFRQGSRIDRLEKKIDAGLKSSQPVPNSPAQVPPVVGTPAQAPAPVQTVVPASVAVPAAVASSVSEEAHVTEEKTGRLLGSVGVGAVFLGVVFFLKYAFDNNWIGETGRVMLGVVVGILLLGIGQFLRKKYLQYSDLLMGGGIGVLYLSIFSAFSYYHLIPSAAAFLLMACVTALAMVVSVVNATIVLSIVGILGGFLTPSLVGENVNNMIGLLTYITLLNVGILGVSIFKKWQPLVYVGAVGTLVDFGGWFAQYYNATELWGTFAFVFITFVIYIWASIARNIIAKIKAEGADILLLSANTATFSWISYIILDPLYHAYLGFGAVLLAALYLIIANFANKLNPEDRSLNFFLSGLGGIFLTIAVPLQFDGSWITTAWLVEALLIYCTASFVENRGFQVIGAVVYVIGLIRFFALDAFSQSLRDFVPIFNKVFWLALLAIVVSYAIAYIYKKYGSTTVGIQKNGIVAFVLAANILTVFIATQQITMYYDQVISIAGTAYNDEVQKCSQMYTGDPQGYSACSPSSATLSRTIQSLHNTANTEVSILWALYALILIVLGFMRRMAAPRRLGLALFGITAVKVFLDVWSLGELYRIISSVGFGVLALGTSFLYAKYKDRLKDII